MCEARREGGGVLVWVRKKRQCKRKKLPGGSTKTKSD